MASSSSRGTAWTPLEYPVFRSLWLAAMASNVGTWVHDVGAAWLMTSLTESATLIALVQAAAMLPMFVFALPAGVIADLFDRRKLLLTTQAWMALAAGGLALATAGDHTSPTVLLAFTFALGCGLAFSAPAWQAVIPELIPRDQLAKAVAINSLGFNAARAVGPALGGLLITMFGPTANFLLNTVSFGAVLLVLARWPHQPAATALLPAERFTSALRVGLRYVRNSPRFKAVMIRGGLFVLAASAWWALLPGLVRFEVGSGAGVYGLVVGTFGAGAVAAAWALPPIRERVSADTLAGGASLVFSCGLFGLALARDIWTLALVGLIAGGAWLSVLSGYNVAAQSSLPSWVRGRALSVYMLVFFGGLAGGSTIWGSLADRIGARWSLVAAATCLILGMLAGLRYRLGAVDPSRLAPSRHWPAPLLAGDPVPEGGPVLVTVEYRIEPEHTDAFQAAMQKLQRSRRRAGSLRWGLWSDAAEPGRYVETFVDESWVEHLRHHERLTAQDRSIEEAAQAFHRGPEKPRVTHYLSSPGGGAMTPSIPARSDDADEATS